MNAPADSSTTCPAGHALSAAWMPASRSSRRYRRSPRDRRAVRRPMGIPPTELRPGFQTVRRSARMIAAATGRAGGEHQQARRQARGNAAEVTHGSLRFARTDDTTSDPLGSMRTCVSQWTSTIDPAGPTFGDRGHCRVRVMDVTRADVASARDAADSFRAEDLGRTAAVAKTSAALPMAAAYGQTTGLLATGDHDPYDAADPTATIDCDARVHRRRPTPEEAHHERHEQRDGEHAVERLQRAGDAIGTIAEQHASAPAPTAAMRLTRSRRASSAPDRTERVGRGPARATSTP